MRLTLELSVILVAVVSVVSFRVNLTSEKACHYLKLAAITSQADILSSAHHLLCYDGKSQSHAPGWDLFQHLGGNGPWIRKEIGVLSHDFALPRSCRVEQAHIVSPFSLTWIGLSA